MSYCHDDFWYPSHDICEGGSRHHHHHHHHSWCHPWYHSTCLTGTISLTEKDGFKIQMDVHHFKIDEINVKTMDDMIVIEGKQTNGDDQPVCITKQFTRKYKLPRGYDPETVQSTLSSDGILHVKAPKPEKMPDVKERKITIDETGSFYGSSKKDDKSVPEKNDTSKEDKVDNNDETEQSTS